MIYGYARVSAKTQTTVHLKRQISALSANGCEQIFYDICSGITMDRPKFASLLSSIQSGDTLMVTSLDRIASTPVDVFGLMQELISKGVCVHALNIGKIDNTPKNMLTTRVMMIFAEYDREMPKDRTQAGREWKRENDPDYKEGRHEVPFDINNPMIQDYLKGLIPATKCYRTLGIKKTTFYARIKEYRQAT